MFQRQQAFVVVCLMVSVFLTGCNRYRTVPYSYNSNPQMSFKQARASCKYFANQARQQAGERNKTYSTSCHSNRYRFGTTVCETRPSSGGGGVWGGIAQGYNEARTKRIAYESAMKSCLASKGWGFKRVLARPKR